MECGVRNRALKRVTQHEGHCILCTSINPSHSILRASCELEGVGESGGGLRKFGRASVHHNIGYRGPSCHATMVSGPRGDDVMHSRKDFSASPQHAGFGAELFLLPPQKFAIVSSVISQLLGL